MNDPVSNDFGSSGNRKGEAAEEIFPGRYSKLALL